MNVVGIDIWREFQPGWLQLSWRSGTRWPRGAEDGSGEPRSQVWWDTAAACRETLLCQGTRPRWHTTITVCQTSKEI